MRIMRRKYTEIASIWPRWAAKAANSGVRTGQTKLFAVFGEEKPFSGFDFELEALLTAAANHADSTSGRQRKPASLAKR
jgi:hypothetical protein